MISISHALLESGGKSTTAIDPQALAKIESAFAAAAAVHVTICAAAGDWGSAGWTPPPKKRAHLDYPASSKQVLACGGTVLTVSADGNTIETEVTWNQNAAGAGKNGATGGGISEVFPVPAWQQAAVTFPTPRTETRAGACPTSRATSGRS